MVPKRKRQLEDFDPNKSDSEDENFDPTEAKPQRSTKKPRSVKGSKSGRKRSHRYRGSDIDDDDEALSDSEGLSYDEESEKSEEDDEEAPVNAAGRRARKAAVKRTNYAESDDS